MNKFMIKKTFCFDIDNVICKTKGRNYRNSRPISNAIKKINCLYEKGHTIKIFTARYMGRNKDNYVLAKKQGKNLTLKQLKKWGVRYHKLYMSKPAFDLLIDDKAFGYKKDWYSKIK